MTPKKHKEENDIILKMLTKFHEEFVKIPVTNGNNNALGENFFSYPLIEWANKFFKKHCGMGINSKFKAETIWSNMCGQKGGAPFETYFRIDRFWKQENKNTTTYRIFLSTHNMDADTDMSDGIIMYIEFEVTDKFPPLGYSLYFDF